MADLGIARPQELLASLPGKIELAPTMARVRKGGNAQEQLRRRPQVSETGSVPEENTVDLEALEAQVDRLNEQAKSYRLRFEIDDSSSRIIVQIVDEESGEVLRTVPPSAVLNLRDRLLSEPGLLVDAES